MTADPTAPAAPPESDDGYPALEALVRARVATAAGPLFSTNAGHL